MSGTDDLVTFLRDRLSEREALVRYAQASGSPFVVPATTLLAEVVAKRRILELHEPVPSHYSDGRYVRDEPGDPQCAYCAGLCHSRSGSSCEVPDAPWPCPTIRLVAQPYAGQPGWREEWRA